MKSSNAAAPRPGSTRPSSGSSPSTCATTAQATWNALAQQCFNGTSTCPSHQLAIVLDDVIQSAPTVQTPDFPGTVQISGAFSENEVRSLARVLNRGAFPVTVVQQRVETVSPTAGQSALEAAVIAGLIGVAIMLIVMAFYYRRLSVVIFGGLAVWGLTVFTAASFVSNQWNYALTLAGVTGIIVSVGVTVDSYVVYFERIRDETRHGRSLANAAPRSFAAIWRTIVAADVVALLAAVVLFWLSVGSVKGFALYLGLTTVCDLLVCYFFTRPATCLLAQSRWAQGKRTSARRGADRSDVMRTSDVLATEPTPPLVAGVRTHPLGPTGRVPDGVRLHRRPQVGLPAVRGV